MKRISVIGAGISGLATSILLKKAGYDVQIYEKNSFPGGKVNQILKSGFRFDTGASLITMPFVIQDFFKEIGENINEYMELIKLPVNCKYFWKDGTVFNSYNLIEELYGEIIKIFGNREKNSFQKFLNDISVLYEISLKSFMTKEFSVKNFFNIKGIFNAHNFVSKKPYSEFINEYFRDGKLRQVFYRFATYNGSSPYLTPKLFSVIPYVEFKIGGWYINGGIYKLIESLVRLCKKYSIKINYDRYFYNCRFDGNKINELILQDKDINQYKDEKFDYLVSSVTNQPLLSGKSYVTMKDWSMSGFILFIGIMGKTEDLEHHNILFSENYENEFHNIFERKIPAEDMTIYISITSRTNLTDAPENSENWFVLVNAPYISDVFKWTKENSERYKNLVIKRIEEYGIKIRDRIIFADMFTPEDFLKRYNSEYGSIYGLSSNSLGLLLKRPGNKSRLHKNLYFAGGNSHPGGGIPLCFLSAKIISNLLKNKVNG